MKLSLNMSSIAAGVAAVAGLHQLKGSSVVSAFTVIPRQVGITRLSTSTLRMNNDGDNHEIDIISNSGRRDFLALMGGLSSVLGVSSSASAMTLDPKKKYYREPYFESSRDAFRSPALRAKLQEERESRDPVLLAAKQKREAEAAEALRIQEEKEKEREKEEARLADEERKKEEEAEKLRLLNPPEVPRVLVLGGTGTVGKAVRKSLSDRGIFVLATSRDGRDGTTAFDVTKNFSKVQQDVAALAKDNKISAVVSCIGSVEADAQVNGATAQAALGARTINTVRNFVALGASPGLIAKTPPGLEGYVKTKKFNQEVVTNKFADTPEKDGFSYTVINPGAIGKSKNYGDDKSVPLKVVVDAVTVGALQYYLTGEESEILNSVEEIKAKAKKIDKVNQTFKK